MTVRCPRCGRFLAEVRHGSVRVKCRDCSVEVSVRAPFAGGEAEAAS
jgi:phage FluMu protein Com